MVSTTSTNISFENPMKLGSRFRLRSSRQIICPSPVLSSLKRTCR